MRKEEYDRFEREQRRQWGEAGDAIYRDREQQSMARYPLIQTVTEQEIALATQKAQREYSLPKLKYIPAAQLASWELKKFRIEIEQLTGRLIHLEDTLKEHLQDKKKGYVKYE